MLTVTPKSFQAAIRHAWRHSRHRPIMCWGPPGASKTASAALVAQEMGVPLVDLRLGDLVPSDLRGLPVIDQETGTTRYFPPAELPREGEGILMLDEINLAPPALQGLAQQLVLKRRLGEYRLPEGWLLIAMGNRKEDRAAVHAMPAPVANRFKHYNLHPSVDDFTEWALRTGSVHEHILAFLRYRPELLHKFDPNAPAWPSPSSWHIASDNYRHQGSVVPSVGVGPGLEFEAYLQVYQQLPDVNAIIAGRGSKERAPTEPSTRYALTMARAGRTDDHDSAANALEWTLEHLSDELTHVGGVGGEKPPPSGAGRQNPPRFRSRTNQPRDTVLSTVMPEVVRHTFRLRPGRLAERSLIAEWHRTRWVWNQAVATLQSTSVWVSDKDLTRWRAEHAWLREGSVVAQQQELRNFRAKRAKGKGRKRFKSAKRSRPSMNYTLRGFSLSSEGRLRLPGGVSIPAVWSRELPSRPSSVRVYRDPVGHWYASFVVAAPEAESLPASDAAIGIDWGVKQLATTTDPSYDLAHAHFGRRTAQRLARYQRRMARRRPQPGKRASRGYKHAKRLVARQHRKVARQRLDTARKWAKRVTRDHAVIAIEDFRPAFLAKSNMARTAVDGSIATLKRVLIEAAERSGRQVVRVDPKHTTMDCSACGARTKQRLRLSERTFHCPTCGAQLDRDVNAARNVLARAGFHPAAVDVVRQPTPSGVAAD